jgi:branched-chain amino acid transport system ATP-binding protein
MMGIDQAPPAAAVPGAPAALSVREVSVRFGGLMALDGVSFDVRPGEMLGIIGPNGAGKSTLLDCVSGLRKPTSGKVFLAGTDVAELPGYRRAGLGLGRTFQAPALLSHLDVIGNVMLGRHSQTKASVVGNLLMSPRTRREERESRERALAVLAELGVGHLAARKAHDLAHGELRVAELARALVMEPSVLLLDEPTSGMTMPERHRIGQMLARISGWSCSTSARCSPTARPTRCCSSTRSVPVTWASGPARRTHRSKAIVT